MWNQGIPEFVLAHYEIHQWRHATAILRVDFPDEWQDIVDILNEFRLYRSEVEVGGGNKSPVAKRIDSAFYKRGWIEKSFDTRIFVDDEERKTPTHKIDCYRNHIGLEVEWNNKDPFFDRDLNNFRLLFELHAISVGVIITRADGLRGLLKNLNKSAIASTTHMSKLLPRLEGGSGGGCPILVFGITKELYVEDI
ncbi:MAG: restriction endonuclease [Anaerolineae bacterium]|nr:restriction endonuclease [Anaerolineae bacterium]